MNYNFDKSLVQLQHFSTFHFISPCIMQETTTPFNNSFTGYKFEHKKVKFYCDTRALIRNILIIHNNARCSSINKWQLIGTRNARSVQSCKSFSTTRCCCGFVETKDFQSCLWVEFAGHIATTTTATAAIFVAELLLRSCSLSCSSSTSILWTADDLEIVYKLSWSHPSLDARIVLRSGVQQQPSHFNRILQLALHYWC